MAGGGSLQERLILSRSFARFFRRAALLTYVCVLTALLPQGAEAAGRLFIQPWCREAYRGPCSIKYQGNVYYSGMAYWIAESRMLADGTTRYTFVDAKGSLRTLDVRGSAHNAAGVSLKPLDGWKASETRPEPPPIGTDVLARGFQSFVGALSAWFPFIQLLVGGLLAGFYFLVATGKRILTQRSDPPAPGLAIAAVAVVVVTGAVPGSAYHELLERYEAFVTYVNSRSLGNGLYLPLDLRYKLPGSFRFHFWSGLYLLVLMGAGTVLLRSLPSCIRPAIAGLQHLTTSHPAEPAISAALARSSAIDTASLERGIEEASKAAASARPPSEFRSRSYARRADALADRLEADTRLAEAVIARERARADAEYWQQAPHRSTTRVREAEERIAALEREIASLREELAKRPPPAPGKP